MLGVAGVDYWKRYTNYIDWCRQHPPKDGEPIERHHVLPRSLFPALAKYDGNLVSLTPRQHFVAHYILAHTDFPEMGVAFNLFCQDAKYRMTSRQYEFAKLAAKQIYKTPRFRENHLNGIAERTTSNLEWRKNLAESNRKQAKDPKYIARMTEVNRKTVSSSDWHEKLMAGIARRDTDPLMKTKRSVGQKKSWLKRGTRAVRRIETGEIFSSCHAAAVAMGIVNHVARAIERGDKCGGYHWEYVNG